MNGMEGPNRANKYYVRITLDGNLLNRVNNPEFRSVTTRDR